MLTVKKERPRLISELSPDIAKLIEDVTVGGEVRPLAAGSRCSPPIRYVEGLLAADYASGQLLPSAQGMRNRQRKDGIEQIIRP
jgi:hypothetical protein